MPRRRQLVPWVIVVVVGLVLAAAIVVEMLAGDHRDGTLTTVLMTVATISTATVGFVRATHRPDNSRSAGSSWPILEPRGRPQRPALTRRASFLAATILGMRMLQKGEVRVSEQGLIAG